MTLSNYPLPANGAEIYGFFWAFTMVALAIVGGAMDYRITQYWRDQRFTWNWVPSHWLFYSLTWLIVGSLEALAATIVRAEVTSANGGWASGNILGALLLWVFTIVLQSLSVLVLYMFQSFGWATVISFLAWVSVLLQLIFSGLATDSWEAPVALILPLIVLTFAFIINCKMLYETYDKPTKQIQLPFADDRRVK